MSFLLCKTLNEKTLKNIFWPAIIQPKEDGLRIGILSVNGGLNLFTRRHKPLHIPALECTLNLPNGFYDGELLFDGMDRKTGNGLGLKAQKNNLTPNEQSKAYVRLWDYIDLDAYYCGVSSIPYRTRYRDLLCKVPGHLVVISHKVYCLEEALGYYKNYRSIGKEGAILKDLDGPWFDGRSAFQLKLKNFQTIDLRVIGIVEGKGKHEGRMGALECASDDGLIEVSVGSGFTDSQREIWWNSWETLKGCIIEIKFNELITNLNKPGKYSLFLPTFTSCRPDKNTTTTLEEL